MSIIKQLFRAVWDVKINVRVCFVKKNVLQLGQKHRQTEKQIDSGVCRVAFTTKNKWHIILMFLIHFESLVGINDKQFHLQNQGNPHNTSNPNGRSTASWRKTRITKGVQWLFCMHGLWYISNTELCAHILKTAFSAVFDYSKVFSTTTEYIYFHLLDKVLYCKGPICNHNI